MAERLSGFKTRIAKLEGLLEAGSAKTSDLEGQLFRQQLHGEALEQTTPITLN